MKKIILGFILTIITFVFLPLVMRKTIHQHDIQYDYLPSLKLCLEYFEDFEDNSNALDTFVTNTTHLKETISNGYNFGDFTKSVYYVITSAIGIILIPLDFVVYCIGFINWFVNV